MGLFKIEPIMIKLFLTILLATFFPTHGVCANFLNYLTKFTISLLFFLHGSKLSKEKIISGGKHWKLHLAILFSTFCLFPVLGLIINYWHPINAPAEIYQGFIYLCVLPATLQSAIAFTSMAGGNVAAAVCSASASTILGLFISPFLTHVMIHTPNNHSSDTIGNIINIVLCLLLPFILGNLLANYTNKWISKNKLIMNAIDQWSILLVVYSAISEAVSNGIWNQVNYKIMLWILLGCTLLLTIILIANLILSRLLRFNKSDEIVVLFCGSKKSLANGIPMAHILFSSNIVGIILLPLMIFHQIQLIFCSFIVQMYNSK